MPETPRSTTQHYRQDGPAQDRPPAPRQEVADLGPRLRRLAVLPTLGGALLGAGVAAFAWAAGPDGPAWVSAVVAGCALVFLAAVVAIALRFASRVEEDLGLELAAVRRSVVETHYKIWQVLDEMQRSLPPEQRWAVPAPGQSYQTGDADEVLSVLRAESHLLRQVADALVARGAPAPAAPPARPQNGQAVPALPAAAEAVPIANASVHSRVGIFVNLARRLQSLVHREIEQLDELENQVEDPDLLKGLFAVDHLATRIRRHAENLAVLGGAPSRRQWSRPVNVYEALRSAVAEVEQYARVKLVRPIEGTLKGHAVADIIHLVAELVENATAFSAPSTQVLIRVQRVRTGLAVEVEDRGLGMEPEERERYNMMLAAPDDVDLDDLLADGRIGLYVVAALARRHDLTVQLQTNIFGGTQSILVIGEELLGESPPSAGSSAPASPAPASNPDVDGGLNGARNGNGMPVRRPAAPPAGPGPALPSVQLSNDTGRHRRAQPAVGNGTATQQMQRPVPDQAAPVPAYAPSPAPAHNPAANGSGPREDPAGRPALPKRNKQTHLAPQLREAPRQVAARGSDAGHDPGLMKAFQQGQSRAESTDQTPQIPNSGSSFTQYRNEEA